MSETYIFEGNTTNEAIEKGLKELKVSKNQVEITVLEENKRSFFSILAPRVVKVQFKLKNSVKKVVKKEIVISEEEIEKALIGYRGETLNALDTIINSVLINNKIHVRVSCNINNYREKRMETLNELADKISKTVIKTGKNVTLDPMPAYERKIIHTRLQNSSEVKTYSVGEGARRRIVISLK